jgi:mannitol-specific phosphotransferase system IIBC component
MDDQAAPTPRLVKKAAVAYDLNALPPALIRSYSVLRRKLERAGFRIEVVMRPLGQLPPDVDVLFVADELVESARQTSPEAQVMPLHLTQVHQPAFDELLQHLNSGQALYALRVEEESEQTDASRRVIVRYRGNEKLY